jgi:Fe-S cluster assembly protein SufD
VNVDAVRLVFVDGEFRPELSDALQESGFEIEINDDRQRLSAPVQPEVFLHLTESLARSVTHIRVKRNQRPAKPLLLMHITQGWTATKSTPRTIATILSWRRGRRPR